MIGMAGMALTDPFPEVGLDLVIFGLSANRKLGSHVNRELAGFR
jgi:hypothetical protein